MPVAVPNLANNKNDVPSTAPNANLSVYPTDAALNNGPQVEVGGNLDVPKVDALISEPSLTMPASKASPNLPQSTLENL